MTNTLRSSLVASVLVATAGAASAADLVIYEPVASKPAASSGFDWAGFYAGVHGGYAWGSEADNQSEVIGGGGGGGDTGGGDTGGDDTGGGDTGGGDTGGGDTGDAFDMDGFIGGVHAGYNWQDGNFVFGIEGDADFSDVSGGTDFNYGGSLTGDISLATHWQASLRLRGGVAMDNLLLYGTAGVAFAAAELASEGDANNSSDTNVHLGWTVGAGLEYALSENWIARGEVRYTDFAPEIYMLEEGPVESSWTQTAVTAGLSYKF